VSAAIVIGYTAARVWQLAGSAPRFLPDTIDYQRIAAEPISRAFFRDVKPWGVPLFYKVLPAAAQAAPLAQLVVSIGSWLVLAFVVGSCFERSAIRTAAIGGVLAFSCSPLVAQWDGVLLSESLSLSLLALVLAATIQLARRPRPAALAAVVGVAALWSSTRDTNAWAWLPIALALFLWLLRRERALAVGLVLSTTGIVAVTAWSGGSPQRWEPLMIDNVNERILADPSATHYFAEHGMPLQSDLRRRLFASRRPLSRFDRDTTLQPFREWLLRSGRATYFRYLLSHPRATLQAPLSRSGLLLSPVGLDYFRPPGFRSFLPGFVDHVLFPRDGRNVLIWIAILAAAGAVASRRARPTGGASALAVAAIGAVIVLAILIWAGEPREVPRHELVPIVMSRLSLLALCLAILAGISGRQGAAKRSCLRVLQGWAVKDSNLRPWD
jgi:hypothetical protein